MSNSRIVRTSGRKFVIEGGEESISVAPVSGEFHYWRNIKEYWPTVLRNVKKNLKLEHPSILAASSKSAGIVLKNWRNRKILKTPPPKYEGTMRGLNVSIQPRCLNRMKWGINVTAAGSISVPSITMKRKSRPNHRSRAKLNATRDAEHSCPITHAPVTIRLLTKKRWNGMLSNTRA